MVTDLYNYSGGEGAVDASAPTFLRHAGVAGKGAVVISVPHAGRTYDPAILARLRRSAHELRLMEDRFADLLVAPLVAAGYPVLLAQVPRAVVDLNRDERDIDPRLVRNIPYGQPLIQSAKQRGGLGVFPRSLPGAGDLWRGSIDWEEAQRRIEQVHRPYHQMLGRMLEDVQAAHGVVLLLDVHSMPPLAPVMQGLAGGEGEAAGVPDLVIGDRFGASADGRLSALALAVAETQGLHAALNHPYAGSYLLDRHGKPGRGRHALQIEISRALYLDEALDQPAEGVAHVQALLLALVHAMVDELSSPMWRSREEGWPKAAE